MDYTDAEIFTSLACCLTFRSIGLGNLSCFLCVDHKGGTVPEKCLLVLMRYWQKFLPFEVQDTLVLLLRSYWCVSPNGTSAVVLPLLSDMKKMPLQDAVDTNC